MGRNHISGQYFNSIFFFFTLMHMRATMSEKEIIKNHDALPKMKVLGPVILSWLLVLDLNTNSGHS